MEQIPPTQNALVQHVKRAAYQGGYCWHTCLDVLQRLPSPVNWGWVMSDQQTYWQPVWTTIPDIAKRCPELIKCGCKKGCSNGRCKCLKALLPCTALCFCEGACASG